MQSRECSIMLYFHLGFHFSGLQKFSFGVSGIQRVNLCNKWIFSDHIKLIAPCHKKTLAWNWQDT